MIPLDGASNAGAGGVGISMRKIATRSALWGLFAAVAGAALPASVRAAMQGRPALLLGVAIWALLTVPSVLAVLGVALARQVCVDLPRDRQRAILVASSLGLAAFFPATFVVGSVLHRTTHHRGLGGATFGFMALLIGLASVVLAIRLAGWIEGVQKRDDRLGGALRIAAVGCGILVAVVALGRGLGAVGVVWSSLSGQTHVGIVDATVWAFCLGVGGLTRRPEKVSPRLFRVLVPVCCALAVAATALVLCSPAVVQAIASEAPVAALLAQVIGIM